MSARAAQLQAKIAQRDALRALLVAIDAEIEAMQVAADEVVAAAPIGWKTPAVAAAEWGYKTETVQTWCREGLIPGAAKHGGEYRIPANAELPAGVRAPRRRQRLSTAAPPSGKRAG